MRTPPRLLTIAGSDSGGGAGIQADLKTFSALGCYGMTVVTAVTAQNTREVTAVHEIPDRVVGRQIDAVFEDIGVDAIKIGMLGTSSVVETVAARLRARPGPPVVIDPVMVAKSGATLLADDAVAALVEEIVPLATVLTPNLPEASRIAGFEVRTVEDRRRAAAVIRDLGCRAVLVKGGHGAEEDVVDLLVSEAGPREIRHRRIETESTHGTGCTLSSAIAALMGLGHDLEGAVTGGIDYLQGALEAAFPLGSGHGPVHHFYRGCQHERGADEESSDGPGRS